MKSWASPIPSYTEQGHGNMQSTNDDVNRMGEVIDRTQRELNQTRHNLEDHVEASRTRLRVLWAIVILLALVLGGTSWYAYRSIGGIPHLAEQINQIPGLQRLAGAVDDRLKSVEGKMTDWANDQTSLTERMAKLEKTVSSTVSSNVRAVRNQAQSAANEVGQRIRQEISQNLQRLQNRVESVESNQREAHDLLAAAQTEIGSLRQEIVTLQNQNAERLAALQQTQTNVNRLNGQVVGINDQLVAHTDSLNALNDEVEREPHTFDLSTSRTRQVAPGIYVTVSHTDVAHQRVDGWVQLSDEGRIVWIRQLGAERAFPFFIRSDNRAYQLVFTSVLKNGATGYVLVPHASQTPVTSADNH